MGSFPAMNPIPIIHLPANAQLNIVSTPLITFTKRSTVTGFSIMPLATVSGADASSILIKLVNMAAPTNIVAQLNINLNVNMVANTANECTLNSTFTCINAGTTLALIVNCVNVTAVNLGTVAKYQLDYVVGYPGGEG